jgi:hypothetical protein
LSWQSVRARLAATERHHPDVDTTELRRDLAVARLEEHIERVVAELEDAFTDRQRLDLVALLTRAAGGSDAAA